MENLTKLLSRLSSEISDSLIELALYDFFSKRAPITDVYRFKTLEPYWPHCQNRHYLVSFINPYDAVEIAPQLALKTFANDSILIELNAINPIPL